MLVRETEVKEMRLNEVLTLVIGLMAAMVVIMSCSDSDKPSETVEPINANFFDGDLTTGYYCICWDQYYGETKATAGSYKLRMVAGEFDNEYIFEINSAVIRRQPPQCCDTATKTIYPLDKIAKDPPEFFGADLDTNAYASGDTVHVEIAVPASSRVKLEISPISTR